MIVYVDDIVLSGDDADEITRLKRKMGNEYEIKDLENLKYFFHKEGISISLRKYTLDLLTEIGMLGCRPANTQIEPNAKLRDTGDQVLIDKEKYECLVDKLIYLSHTRPDISYVVSIVSQFMQTPYEEHMEAVNKILRYLKTTHFIKEKLDSGSICTPYIPSSQQIVDILIKELLRQSFESCVSKLGLFDIYDPT